MKKLTQTQVKEKADEWAVLEAKIKNLEAKRNAELDPLIRRHAAETAPIYDRHDPKIKALYEKKFAIESEVIAWLDAQGKPITVAGNLGVAANEIKIGNRVIDARKFFDLAKDKFWECVTVGVAKAEKLLGKTAIDEVSVKETKLVASLKLKAENHFVRR